MLRKAQSFKTETGRNRNYEPPNYKLQIEAVINKFPKGKSSGPDGFTGEFHQTFRDEQMPILLKLSQKNCRERNTSKLILRSYHHRDTKTRQRQDQIRKLQANITDEHRCKRSSAKFQHTEINNTSKIIIKLALFQGCKDSAIFANQCDGPY